VTEAELQAKIIELARWTGWRVFHPRTAQYADGRYATMYIGEAGFPDLVLCHPRKGVIFAELKTDKGRPTVGQQLWLDELDEAGAEVYLWRPKHWADIEARLR
jgi:hypothetical protein